ncbi:hypothetical protein D3C76_1826180 [compost metagenome]
MEAINRMASTSGEAGYGIRNVDRRIKLHFGSEYGIHYRRREGGGTAAAITLPLIAAPDPQPPGPGCFGGGSHQTIPPLT